LQPQLVCGCIPMLAGELTANRMYNRAFPDRKIRVTEATW
jgi:hypothetical protein